MRTFIWLSLLCVFCISCNAQCVFTENDFYTYTEVMNCFHSILLTDDVKFPTLETLKRSIELYAFYDIAHNSPDPNLPLHVDMQRGFEEISNRPYIYDFDFQNDLRYLYLQVSTLYFV